MVKIIRTWETVTFLATQGEYEETVELNMNNDTKSYTLCSPNEEMVNLNDKDKTQLKLLMEILKAAHKYLNENLFKE